MINGKVTINLALPIILTIIFVVLKLKFFIEWSWFWVLCPLWIPFLAATYIVLFGKINWNGGNKKYVK